MSRHFHFTKIAAFSTLLCCCFVFASLPFFAHANTAGGTQQWLPPDLETSPKPGLDYAPLVPLPGVTEPGTDHMISNLSTYIVGMFQLLIGVAAALAVVMIVIGGIEYMSTDAIGGKSDGKKKIENALWGLALAISSYLILNTIDPSFLNSDIDVASQQQQSTTQ